MSDTITRTTNDMPQPTGDGSRFPWIILLVCCIVLLPVLAFPFGQDQSTFVRGGRALLAGGTLYVDFIDVKPPLIYLVFGIADALSGGSVVLIRVFEIVVQLATIAMLLRVMQSVTSNRIWLWCTAIIYTSLYSTLGYSQIGQAESFAALPIVAALWAGMQRSGNKRWIVLAVCMPVVFMLKYTLVAIGPAAMIVWLLRDGQRASIRAILSASLASVVLCFLAYLPLIMQDGFLDGMRVTMQYLSVYSSYPPLGALFAVQAIKTIGTFFGDNLTIGITFLTLVGAATLLTKRHSTQAASLVSAALWMFLVLGVTVVLERKFSPYHFSRLYIPIGILAGASVTLWPLIRDRVSAISRESRWALIGTMSVLVLFFSPLPRLVNVAQLALRSIGNPHVYDAYLTRPHMPGFDYTAIRGLKTYLDEHLVADDSVMLMSMMATPILSSLPTKHTSSFADSHLYFGTGAAPSWRKQASVEMALSDWVIVDTVDASSGVNLHPRTSWQSLQIDPLMMPILRSSFTPIDTVEAFIIYKRIDS